MAGTAGLEDALELDHAGATAACLVALALDAQDNTTEDAVAPCLVEREKSIMRSSCSKGERNARERNARERNARERNARERNAKRAQGMMQERAQKERKC